MYQLIVLSALVLLPLIPAFLLFKILRSDAKVDGDIVPGLKVSLGGAFGGYVALTVFLATYFAHMPHTTTWHVEGELQFPEGSPSVINWQVHPPMFSVDGENKFSIDLPIADENTIPSIVIDANGYPSKTITLTDPDGRIGGQFKAQRFISSSTIQLTKPITFTKPGPAYQPPKPSEGGKS